MSVAPATPTHCPVKNRYSNCRAPKRPTTKTADLFRCEEEAGVDAFFRPSDLRLHVTRYNLAAFTVNKEEVLDFTVPGVVTWENVERKLFFSHTLRPRNHQTVCVCYDFPSCGAKAFVTRQGRVKVYLTNPSRTFNVSVPRSLFAQKAHPDLRPFFQ